MSQMLPEPPDPEDTAIRQVNVPADSTVMPSEPVNVPTDSTVVPSEPAGALVEPAASVPVAPAAVPPVSANPPGGTDWRRLSLEWMQKSQEITARWLYDLGGWVFGGLIVVALMLLQDFISLGFADRAVLVAGLAIAIALPFNLAGLGIIRYFNDLTRIVEEARQTLGQDGNLSAETLIKLTSDTDAFPPNKHKTMDFSISLALYLSVFFTVIGLGSALWRISWVATVLFIVASVSGVWLVLRVVRSS